MGRDRRRVDSAATRGNAGLGSAGTDVDGAGERWLRRRCGFGECAGNSRPALQLRSTTLTGHRVAELQRRRQVEKTAERMAAGAARENGVSRPWERRQRLGKAGLGDAGENWA